MIRVVAHLRGEGPDQRVELTTPASADEILAELRRPDGLAALTDQAGVVTMLNVARVGWVTLTPAGAPTA